MCQMAPIRRAPRIKKEKVSKQNILSNTVSLNCSVILSVNQSRLDINTMTDIVNKHRSKVVFSLPFAEIVTLTKSKKKGQNYLVEPMYHCDEKRNIFEEIVGGKLLFFPFIGPVIGHDCGEDVGVDENCYDIYDDDSDFINDEFKFKKNIELGYSSIVGFVVFVDNEQFKIVSARCDVGGGCCMEQRTVNLLDKCFFDEGISNFVSKFITSTDKNIKSI